jgi:hypothetical protein
MITFIESKLKKKHEANFPTNPILKDEIVKKKKQLKK